jgi:hypothetical protein
MKLPLALLLTLAAAAAPAAEIASPSQHLKMNIGADKTLADYRQMTSYFRMLDAASPRVDIENLGKTVLGEEMIMVVISSEENIRNKAKIRQAAKQLADPRGVADAELQHPFDRNRGVADGDGVGPRAGHGHRRGDETPPR